VPIRVEDAKKYRGYEEDEIKIVGAVQLQARIVL